MTHSTPRRDGDRFAMPWALPDEDTDPDVEVIDLTDAAHDIRHDGRCPACSGAELDIATTSAGTRYERCLSCNRLWSIDGDTRRLVVGM